MDGRNLPLLQDVLLSILHYYMFYTGKGQETTHVKLQQLGFSSSNHNGTTQWNEDLRTWDQRFDMLYQCLCTLLLLLHQHLRDLEILSWTSQQTDSRLDPGWLLIYPNNYRH